jgi:hypothetical protein
MKEKYRGDSYDLVKRFFSQVLDPIARLYAHPKFVPREIHDPYTRITTLPILPETEPDGRFGIVLDPDTGVRLRAKVPDAAVRHVSPRHLTLQFIVDLNNERHPEYMICFDQSHHRKHEHSKRRSKESKDGVSPDAWNTVVSITCPMPLFCSRRTRPETLRSILDRLLSVGIPGCHFEPCEISK